MKYRIIQIAITWTIISTTYAQVGINIKNPIGIFHLDGKGNTTSALNGTDILDDIIIETNTTGAINHIGVGIGCRPHHSSQIEFGASDKALLLNRVNLTSTTDKTTISTPEKGMIIYNTNETTMEKGLYAYDGSNWLKVATSPFSGEATNYYKLNSDALTTGISTTAINANKFGGVLLDFRSSISNNITIGESGSFAFSIRLYGNNGFGTQATRINYYAFLVRRSPNYPKVVDQLVDAAGLATTSIASKALSVSVVLGGVFSKGDIVHIYLCHNNDLAYPWRVYGNSNLDTVDPAATNLIYWKL